MPPWTFVGRSAALERLLAAANAAPGRGLVFGGGAGIGKTRLLREGLRALDADRLAVWTATATAATTGLPLGSLAPSLPPDQPPGGTSVALLRWAVDSLDRQAAGRPIVVAIDNSHLLDPLSAALVYYLARSERATVFAAVRTGEPAPESIRALWTDDLVDRIELGPLTHEETADLLKHALGGPVDPASVDRLWQLSQGNALLLRELVLAARAAGTIVERFGVRRWTGQLDLAPSLTEIIDARVGLLTSEVRTVLELIAFGEPIGLALLTRAADPEAVEMAEERGLLRVVRDGRRTIVRLAQPLYGEVVRQRCPLTRIRRLKATLADLTESVGANRRDDLLRVAVWRLDSDTATDPKVLLAACQRAFARYDIPLAGRLAKAAVSLGGGLVAALALASTLICAGRPEESVAILDQARPLVVSERDQVNWMITRAVATYWGLGDLSTIGSLALASTQIADPRDQARAMAVESLMRLHHGECASATTLARQVLDNPASAPDPRALAHCTMAYLRAARGAPRQVVRAMGDLDSSTATLRLASPALQFAVEFTRGTAMVLAGDLPAIGATAAAEFSGMVRAGEFRMGSGYLAILRAQAARLGGALSEAAGAAAQAAATLHDTPLGAGLAHAERAHIAALGAHSELAAEAMTEADRTASQSMTIMYPWFEHARCWVLVSAGKLEEALSVTDNLVTRLRADGFATHEVVALHDIVRLGRLDEAIVERLIALSATVESQYATLVARYAGALFERDGARLLVAADGFAECGMYLYAAESAVGAVTLLRAARSPQTPRASQRVAELLESCQGAKTPPLAVQRPRLTGRERQVARLAAVGVSSKEIAEQLYLSSRTVDNHLMRVYAKLGVSGRSELAAALGILPYDTP
ncbi:MAG: LuxR family transcriptional regulator [Micromonosporaceae bacterium]|nr:LuxR family transcriptional regulator [Micromonosporaceae bacterium]